MSLTFLCASVGHETKYVHRNLFGLCAMFLPFGTGVTFLVSKVVHPLCFVGDGLLAVVEHDAFLHICLLLLSGSAVFSEPDSIAPRRTPLPHGRVHRKG